MATQPIDDQFGFDPKDTASAKDPALMDKIRNSKPVSRPAADLVLATGWTETRAVFGDMEKFSSVGDFRAPGVVMPTEESFLGELDAPLHPKIRAVLLRAFTPKQALAAEGWAREFVRQRLQDLAKAGGGDLMKVLATPAPGSVTAHVMGIPDSLHEEIMDWCSQLLHSTWPALGKTERGPGIAGGFPELAALLDGLIDARVQAGANAPDDVITTMVNTRDADGWSIGTHHIRTLMVNMLAGSLSATYMIGNLAYRFVKDPAFQQQLRAQPETILNAVEESLRIEPPVAFLYRTALEDVKLGGCPIAKGEHVMLNILAAQRDPAIFPDAGSFRLDRENPRNHIAFGYGPHICLGNHLTRMIGRVILEELIACFPAGSLSLAPGFVWQCVDHPMEYGPERLDLVVERTQR
jgi:cytochrome P450